MSSSSPICNPFNLIFDPIFRVGPESGDFTAIYQRHRGGQDSCHDGPFDGPPTGQDGSSGPDGCGDHGRDGRCGQIGPQPWGPLGSPFGSWPGDLSGLPAGWGLNFSLGGQDSPSLFNPDGSDCGGTDDGCRPTGDGHLSVNGTKIDDGQYTIDASNANSGTITVTDNANPNEHFTVWGDPHITTGAGGTANFQHAPVTFKLPDGTEITVTPTDSPGVNTIDHVTVTSGNDAATITEFGSKNGPPVVEYKKGQGYQYDKNTPDGTVVWAKHGNINDLVVGNGGPEIYKKPEGNIDPYASLSVGGPAGDTVYDGRYTIVASDVDKGTLTVTDNVTHETFTVWGDPHIDTSAGGTGDFQHTPVTFNLPDGTEITVTPTNNTGPHSVNTIDHVTITKGNQAVTITGFGSKSGKLDVDYRPHAGYCLDAHTPDGVQLYAKNGNIDDLVGKGGLQIYNNPNVVHIDNYAGRTQPPGGNDGWPPPIYPVLGDLNPTALGILRMILADNPLLGGWPGSNFSGWPASNRDWWWMGFRGML